MRIWPARPEEETRTSTPAETEVVTAVDSALGFVAGQGWLPGRTAISLVESVRDVALERHTSERLRELFGATLEKCDQERVLAATVVDELLDILNAARPVATRS